MDKSLQTLCVALKRIFLQLKSQHQPLSFLLLIGKSNQGKTALLKQSKLTHYPLDTENNLNLFYNNQGIIIELNETWLNSSENLLTYTLKQLNQCHSSIHINGLILCIDSSELLLTESVQLNEQCKNHITLLNRFGHALGYPIDLALILTKLDTLAGFCEFFQSDHPSELSKALGFSIELASQHQKFIQHYKHQFEQLLELLGQQIITKLHPARSSVKRTLIREFPLQFASLAMPLQTLIQLISPKLFRLQVFYFTSAEQGGVSVDRLNKKIQHEYALTVQDKFPQANNYRAYFIEGAIKAFQEQTQKHSPYLLAPKKIAFIAAGLVGLVLCGLIYHHWHINQLLDETSKELLAYETLIKQSTHKVNALYHLALAEAKIGLIPHHLITHPRLDQLKSQLNEDTKSRLQENFLPELLANLQDTMINAAQTPFARYQALKIYLMLGESQYYVESEVIAWFNDNWKNKNHHEPITQQISLLKKILKQPRQPITINEQLVSDTRNYLNALPAAYLYYSLAKINFPKDKKTINVEGFDLASQVLPVYYTQAGFLQIIKQLPQIAQQLQKDNWILARQDLHHLPTQLEQAYCFEYVSWWQNFIRHTQPHHYQSYQQAQQLAKTLTQHQAIRHLINLIQQQTSPMNNKQGKVFNEKIANHFTALNLMSDTVVNELEQNINELEKFLSTLALINDHGLSVFKLTQARFSTEVAVDPLSLLYNRARQLPEPISNWAKQLADDTWFIFINESKNYLNHQWLETVYKDYQKTITHRYPLDPSEQEEITLEDFDRFFAPHGTLPNFVNAYLKPFLDTSKPQWQPKELNGYVLPIKASLLDELIRANVISNMFFPEDTKTSKIDFTLQKINLDPMVAKLELSIGQTQLTDSQDSESYTLFSWPQADAKLRLSSIEGNHYELEERGPWAFFKILEKVNVLVDSNDSSTLQILFEVNGNSGRYLLKTQNQINPFSPGILTGFNLTEELA